MVLFLLKFGRPRVGIESKLIQGCCPKLIFSAIAMQIMSLIFTLKLILLFGFNISVRTYWSPKKTLSSFISFLTLLVSRCSDGFSGAGSSHPIGRLMIETYNTSRWFVRFSFLICRHGFVLSFNGLFWCRTATAMVPRKCKCHINLMLSDSLLLYYLNASQKRVMFKLCPVFTM